MILRTRNATASRQGIKSRNRSHSDVRLLRNPRTPSISSHRREISATLNAMSHRFGFWASTGAATASVAYAVPQVLQVAGLIPDPWDRIFIFAPSLLLAPAFVLAVVAAHAGAAPDRRIYSLAALALALLYAADVSAVYVMQLGAVIPAQWNGQEASLAFAACCTPGMPATAVDLLGYTWMSGATLLLAAVFPGTGLRRWLRLALIANGALAPFLIGQLAWPALIYVGATRPGAGWSAATTRVAWPLRLAPPRPTCPAKNVRLNSPVDCRQRRTTPIPQPMIASGMIRSITFHSRVTVSYTKQGRQITARTPGKWVVSYLLRLWSSRVAPRASVGRGCLSAYPLSLAMRPFPP
jgi:hypothetical protein